MKENEVNKIKENLQYLFLLPGGFLGIIVGWFFVAVIDGGLAAGMEMDFNQTPLPEGGGGLYLLLLILSPIVGGGVGFLVPNLFSNTTLSMLSALWSFLVSFGVRAQRWAQRSIISLHVIFYILMVFGGAVLAIVLSLFILASFEVGIQEAIIIFYLDRTIPSPGWVQLASIVLVGTAAVYTGHLTHSVFTKTLIFEKLDKWWVRRTKYFRLYWLTMFTLFGPLFLILGVYFPIKVNYLEKVYGRFIETDNYSLMLPEEWYDVGNGDSKTKQQIEEGIPNPSEAKLINYHQINVSNNDDLGLLIYEVEYVHKRPSFDERVSINNSNFLLGKQNGIVQKVISNRVTSIGGKQAVETDFLAKSGMRNLNVIFDSENGNISIIVSAFFPHNNSAKRMIMGALVNLKIRPKIESKFPG